MSEVSVATPAPSAPSSGASEGSSSSSTPSSSSGAAPAETKSESPRTSRESSRELLRRQSREALEKASGTATEGEDSEPEENVEGTSEVPKDATEEGKSVEAKPKQSETKEPEPEDRLRIRETLKAIPDKKTREQIAELAFIGKELREVGIRPADAKAYRELYPTVEVAKQASAAAAEAYELARAYHSNSEQGHEYFLNNLRNSNPAAYESMENRIARELPQRNPKLYRDIGQRTARNVITNMRKAAEQTTARGDSVRGNDLGVAAQYVEEFLFPNGLTQQNAPRPANDPVLQENARLKAEFDAMHNQRLQGARQYAFGNYQQAVAQEAAKAIADLDSDNVYGEKARQRMANEVVANVRNKIGNNHHIRTATENLLAQGDGQGAAHNLISQAIPLIMGEVGNVFKDYSDLYERKQAVREEKRAVVTSKKDVGAPASAPRAAAPVRPVDTRGMGSREALRALVSSRMSGRR